MQPDLVEVIDAAVRVELGADRVVDFRAVHGLPRDAAGSQSGLALDAAGVVTLVGYADQRVDQSQGANDLGRRR